MFSAFFARRSPPSLPQYVLVFEPTGTELYRGNVLDCSEALERHAPNATVAEMVQRGYRIRRAAADVA